MSDRVWFRVFGLTCFGAGVGMACLIIAVQQ
jgi:hypothetical protein